MNDQKWGFPGSSAGKESTCNSGDPQFDSRVEKICWRRDRLPTPVFLGFPDGSDSKSEVSACNAEDLGSIPGFGRSSGGGHGNPLQYSCLENPMDRGAYSLGYSLWGRKELDMTERLSTAQQRTRNSQKGGGSAREKTVRTVVGRVYVKGLTMESASGRRNQRKADELRKTEKSKEKRS